MSSIRLAGSGASHTFLPLSNEELVRQLVERLPDDVSPQEIAKEIEFISGVREGLDQLDQGKGVPIADVEKMIDSWSTK